MQACHLNKYNIDAMSTSL